MLFNCELETRNRTKDFGGSDCQSTCLPTMLGMWEQDLELERRYSGAGTSEQYNRVSFRRPKSAVCSGDVQQLRPCRSA
jgi:hypothetical protein